MPDDRDIPLDAAGEPGIAHGEVGGLKDGVDVQELFSARFVQQRPEPSAELQEKRGAQVLVLQDGRFESARRAVAVVLILEAVGEDAVLVAAVGVVDVDARVGAGGAGGFVGAERASGFSGPRRAAGMSRDWMINCAMILARAAEVAYSGLVSRSNHNYAGFLLLDIANPPHNSQHRFIETLDNTDIIFSSKIPSNYDLML